MTWSWSIPMLIVPSRSLVTPPLVAERTRAVVPTFRDWPAARVTIESLLACNPRPGEIVLVNDNSSGRAPAWARRYPVLLIEHGENRGPAFARNAGAALNTGRSFDWLLFTDTGCDRGPTFMRVLSEHSFGQDRSSVAIAGPVRGVVVSVEMTPINYYMGEEGILNPPMQCGMPQAIITANAAVSAAAFRAVGGFDVSYPFAAGEDLDLGLRLRRFGDITWAPTAEVHHAFRESMHDFEKRFERYGAGNAHLQQVWSLESMRAVPFSAHDARLQVLADRQVQAMQRGYDRHRLSSRNAPKSGGMSA